MVLVQLTDEEARDGRWRQEKLRDSVSQPGDLQCRRNEGRSLGLGWVETQYPAPLLIITRYVSQTRSEALRRTTLISDGATATLSPVPRMKAAGLSVLGPSLVRSMSQPHSIQAPQDTLRASVYPVSGHHGEPFISRPSSEETNPSQLAPPSRCGTPARCEIDKLHPARPERPDGRLFLVHPRIDYGTTPKTPNDNRP